MALALFQQSSHCQSTKTSRSFNICSWNHMYNSVMYFPNLLDINETYLCLMHQRLFQFISACSEIVLFPNIWFFKVTVPTLWHPHTWKTPISVTFPLFRVDFLFKLIKFLWNHYSLVQLFNFPFCSVIATHLTGMTLMYSSKLFTTDLNKAKESKATNCGAKGISFHSETD